jgi:hypothetical protein
MYFLHHIDPLARSLGDRIQDKMGRLRLEILMPKDN